MFRIVDNAPSGNLLHSPNYEWRTGLERTLPGPAPIRRPPQRMARFRLTRKAPDVPLIVRRFR